MKTSRFYHSCAACFLTNLSAINQLNGYNFPVNCIAIIHQHYRIIIKKTIMFNNRLLPQ